MNLHIPIHIPTDHDSLFLCSWNDGEIIQVHTESSFMEEYKENLNDHLDDYMFYKFLSNESKLFRTFEDAFTILKEHTIGCKIISDNMTIIKIYEGFDNANRL